MPSPSLANVSRPIELAAFTTCVICGTCPWQLALGLLLVSQHAAGVCVAHLQVVDDLLIQRVVQRAQVQTAAERHRRHSNQH